MPDSPGLGWTELLRDYLAGIEGFQDPSRDEEFAPFAYFLSARYTFELRKETYTSLRNPDEMTWHGRKMTNWDLK